MKTIITEEMRYRERVVQYTIKSNNAVAARRYHTVGNKCSDGERNMTEQRHLCQINRHARILTRTSIQEKK